METHGLYQAEAYRREMETVVVAVTAEAVALVATVFYPGGGGQPHDLGILSAGEQQWPVTKVWREGALIWHGVAGQPPVVGTPVRGVLDWERRYALMRTHTALHILCGVVWRDYGAKVTGGNMEPLAGRMDFEFETLRGEFVREIEEKVNAEIAAARPVRVAFLPRVEADQHPDLIRTKVNLLPADITTVRVVVTGYKSKGRINKRFEIAVE